MAKDKVNYYDIIPKRVYDIMKSLFKEGWSGNAVQRYLTEQGMGQRRSTVQGARREIEGEYKREYFWKTRDKSLLPMRSMFNERDFSAPYKYWVHFETDVYDETGNFLETKTLSMYTDEMKAPSDWEREIYNALNPYNYKDVQFFGDVRIRVVDHKAGQSY